MYHRDRCLIPSGSSPRGRGKRAERRQIVRRWRLIPAWAGKTTASKLSLPPATAHPRVGGENGGCEGREAERAGSSPRGRGKPGSLMTVHMTVRLIPAWAGKTGPQFSGHALGKAHPRVGGENPSEVQFLESRAGSSPRGRGKPVAGTPNEPVGGLIPAWAGKTLHANTPRPAS